MDLKKTRQEFNERLAQLKSYAQPLQQQVITSPYWQQAQQRWQQLTQRERYLVMGAGAALAVMIFYQLIYAPLTSAITRYQQDVINDQELLVYMQNSVPHILAATGQAKPEQTISADMLLPTIENSLTEGGMMEVVSSLNLTNENTVDIQFNEVEFDGLLGWLVQIRKKYGIQVETFSAKPIELPGFASATVQLKLMGS